MKKYATRETRVFSCGIYMFFVLLLFPTCDHIIKRTLHGSLKIVLKTIFYSFAALVRKILFSLLENINI